MSLYSMMFGSNPAAAVVMAALGFQTSDVGRFRDAWVQKDGSEYILAIYTRNGGGNRESYEKEISAMREHACFLRDEDDDFDNTYATFFFRSPEEVAKEIAEAYEFQPDAYTQLTKEERWEQALLALKGGDK